MLMKWITIIILIFSFHVFAGPQGLDCQSSGRVANLDDISEVAETVSEAECPQPSESDIYKLCDNVTQMETDLDGNDIEYFLYEDTLRKISCAKPNSSKEEAGPKIKNMWNKYGSLIKCSIPKFGLSTDSILKYSVKMTFNAFLSSLVRTYKVNLNAKDPQDGKTILEFCQKEVTTLENKVPRPEKFIRDTQKSCQIIEEGMKNP